MSVAEEVESPFGARGDGDESSKVKEASDAAKELLEQAGVRDPWVWLTP